jgi:hypothetical protein
MAVGPQPALLPTMFAESPCVSQSVEAMANQEDTCELHAHTLEVLHQWQELQGAVEQVAALERSAAREDY